MEENNVTSNHVQDIVLRANISSSPQEITNITPHNLRPPQPEIAARQIQNAASGIPLRRRGRRPLTTENSQSLEDSQVLVSLGMSPFLPGQDAIHNRNRFVRNESILARHLFNLEQSFVQSEANYSRRITEVYRLLENNRASLESLTVVRAEPDVTSTGNMYRSDCDFASLRRSFNDTSQIANAILQYLSSSSASERVAMEELNRELEPFRRLRVDFNSRSPQNSTDRVSLSTFRQPPTSVSSHEAIIEDFRHDSHRAAQEDLNSNSAWPRLHTDSPTMSPPSQFLSQQEDTTMADGVNTRFRSRRVLYGPISYHHECSSLKEIAYEALQIVGLSPDTILSVSPAPGRADFLSMQFSTNQDARRFVELVSTTLNDHPPRQAFFVNDEPSVLGTAANDLTVDIGSRSKMRPWQL